MPLKFPSEWRFSRGELEPVSPGAVKAFYSLLLKIAGQAEDRWTTLERFKSAFSNASGAFSGSSSSESWAQSDLESRMFDAAENPALFLEGLYDAIEKVSDNLAVPDWGTVNSMCVENKIPLSIRPPDLVPLSKQLTVAAPRQTPSLNAEAQFIFRESVNRADELLAQSRPREAVQEMLWIFESIVTVFIGVETADAKVKGHYFNQIAKELKKIGSGKTLERAIDWSTALHGYLSSPTGGGVRHGQNLQVLSKLTTEEGRFFCNLIMAYVAFLLSEHEHLNEGE